VKKLSFISLLIVFIPVICNAKPIVIWYSDPVKPGDTVLVFGADFQNIHNIQIGKAAETIHGSPGGAVSLPHTVTIQPLERSPQSVKFVIPRSLSPGIYYAKIETPDGYAALWLNKPQIVWLQGDQGSASSPGGNIRVFGKCLLAKTGRGLLMLQSGAKRVMVTASSIDPFSMQAKMPNNMPLGTCDVYVHTGYGGQDGWSNSASIHIVRPFVIPSRRETIELEMGAEDAHAVTRNIQQALDKVGSAGGGTVFLPRGRYAITGSLTIPRNVRLSGEGEELTALCWSDTETPPDALIAGTDHFQIENLTLYSTTWKHGIVSNINKPDAGHILITHVRMRLDPYRGHITPEDVNKRFVESQKLSTGGGDSLRLGGEDIEVSGCDIYGGGRSLYLERPAGASIHDNTFYNGRWGWYCLTGSNGLILERNRIIGGDLMSTGGGLNDYDTTVSQNVYYAYNELKNMFGWDREAMTTDAGGGAYYGYVADSSGNKVTLAADPKWTDRDWTGAGIFLIDGKGKGQYRQITHYDGRDVEVDHPWRIPPDSTSVATITMIQRNYLFIANSFTDAGVAIQMYGASTGNIAWRNVSCRTAGFHNFGMNYGGVQPSWYNQWLENRITEGNVYQGGHDQSMGMGEAHLGVFAMPPGVEPKAPITLCTIVRGNILDNNAHLAVGGSDPPGNGEGYPYTQEAVVENNTVMYAEEGLILSKSSTGVLARNNTFIHCKQGEVDESGILKLQREAYDKLAKSSKPILHLQFSKQTDGFFPDVTGNGFNAFCVGNCKSYPQDGPGGSVQLDGKSYLYLSRASILAPQTFTISVWFKMDDLAGRWGILVRRLSQAMTPFVLGENNGSALFEASDSHGQWSFNITSGQVFKSGVWHQIAAVVRDKQGVTLYADGAEAAHKDDPESVAINYDGFCIGREEWGGNPPSDHPAFFKGSVADVIMWARALSSEEIKDNYQKNLK
jgi:hypothetical protein